MIVNVKRNGWEIIHQRAHGLLAMQLASHWRPDQRAIRWIETLLAIAEHDDSQEDWQGTNHLNDNGTPMNFDMKKFSLTQARRVTAMSEQKSRWIALLISRHMSFLYEPMRGDNRELDAFLDEQKQRQQRFSRELKVKAAEVQYAYDLMQWCDQFSLILCLDDLPAGQRALEISKGPDGRRYEVVQRTDTTLKVEPWPFESDELTVEVEACVIHQLSFANDSQLLEAIKASPTQTKTWRLTKEDP
jgi:hypothetical protein